MCGYPILTFFPWNPRCQVLDFISKKVTSRYHRNCAFFQINPWWDKWSQCSREKQQGDILSLCIKHKWSIEVTPFEQSSILLPIQSNPIQSIHPFIHSYIHVQHVLLQMRKNIKWVMFYNKMHSFCILVRAPCKILGLQGQLFFKELMLKVPSVKRPTEIEFLYQMLFV